MVAANGPQFSLGAAMISCSASLIRKLFAETIIHGSPERSQTELIALAWTLRNRAERARPENGDETGALSEDDAREMASAMLADLGFGADAPRSNGNGHAPHLPEERIFQQALACVALVCDGLLPDPTNGASRVHPHDVEPAWAEDCEATALIGTLMFLRDDASVSSRSNTARDPAHSTAGDG